MHKNENTQHLTGHIGDFVTVLDGSSSSATVIIRQLCYDLVDIITLTLILGLRMNQQNDLGKL